MKAAGKPLQHMTDKAGQDVINTLSSAKSFQKTELDWGKIPKAYNPEGQSKAGSDNWSYIGVEKGNIDDIISELEKEGIRYSFVWEGKGKLTILKVNRTAQDIPLTIAKVNLKNGRDITLREVHKPTKTDIATSKHKLTQEEFSVIMTEGLGKPFKVLAESQFIIFLDGEFVGFTATLKKPYEFVFTYPAKFGSQLKRLMAEAVSGFEVVEVEAISEKPEQQSQENAVAQAKKELTNFKGSVVLTPYSSMDDFDTVAEGLREYGAKITEHKTVEGTLVVKTDSTAGDLSHVCEIIGTPKMNSHVLISGTNMGELMYCFSSATNRLNLSAEHFPIDSNTVEFYFVDNNRHSIYYVVVRGIGRLISLSGINGNFLKKFANSLEKNPSFLGTAEFVKT